MQKFAMVSRNSDLAEDAASGSVVVIQSGRPMAHQLNSVFGNEPTPQIMIQLIGCRIQTAHPHGDRRT